MNHLLDVLYYIFFFSVLAYVIVLTVMATALFTYILSVWIRDRFRR